jgi:hypothetical protein
MLTQGDKLEQKSRYGSRSATTSQRDLSEEVDYLGRKQQAKRALQRLVSDRPEVPP